jgi:hypothetical protein
MPEHFPASENTDLSLPHLEKNQSSARRGGRFSLRGMRRGNSEQLCFSNAARTGADAFPATVGLVGTIQPHSEHPQAAKLRFSNQTKSIAIIPPAIRRVQCSTQCTPPYIHSHVQDLRQLVPSPSLTWILATSGDAKSGPRHYPVLTRVSSARRVGVVPLKNPKNCWMCGKPVAPGESGVDELDFLVHAECQRPSAEGKKVDPSTTKRPRAKRATP